VLMRKLQYKEENMKNDEMEGAAAKAGTAAMKFRFAAALAAAALAAAASAGVEWEDPQVNSIGREKARTYTVPLASVEAALTDALEFETPYRMSLNGNWKAPRTCGRVQKRSARPPGGAHVERRGSAASM